MNSNSWRCGLYACGEIEGDWYSDSSNPITGSKLCEDGCGYGSLPASKNTQELCEGICENTSFLPSNSCPIKKDGECMKDRFNIRNSDLRNEAGRPIVNPEVDSEQTTPALQENTDHATTKQKALESHIKVNLGNIKTAQGDFESAIKHYADATMLDPTNTDAWITLGLVYHRTNDFQSSVSCVKRAISIDPLNETAHYNLACVYHDLRMFDEAIDMYNTALLCNPLHRDALFNVGLVYKLQGKFDDARKCFRKALDVDPSFTIAEKAIELLGGLT